MSLLRDFVERRNTGDSYVNEIVRARASGSVNVSGFNSMAHSAVFACVNLIADGVSSLPVDVFEKRQGTPIEVDKPDVLVDPSDWCSDVDWRRQRLIAWLLCGNAYGLITKTDSVFRPKKVEMLDPNSVTVKEDKNSGLLSYKVNGKPVDSNLVVHWPGLLLPGSRVGVSQISFAAAQIKMGLQAQRTAQDYFTRGTKANGVVHVNAQRGTNEQADEVKKRFVHAAQDANEPVVLFGDTKYTPLNVNAADMLFLESSNASGQDIARFFGVPAEMIGLDSGSSMTYSNIESRSRHTLQYTLNPWIIRQEKADQKFVPSPQYVKVNRDAALAIDTLTRYQAHDIAIRSGLSSRNERRDIEDLPPVQGGDETLWPPYATNIMPTQGQN